MIKTVISREDMREILTEMCRRVGVDVNTMDFSKQNWYWDHEWTAKEEADFQKWLGVYLREHNYVGKGKKRGEDWGEYEAGKIIANYGWKTKQK